MGFLAVIPPQPCVVGANCEELWFAYVSMRLGVRCGLGFMVFSVHQVLAAFRQYEGHLSPTHYEHGCSDTDCTLGSSSNTHAFEALNPNPEPAINPTP